MLFKHLNFIKQTDDKILKELIDCSFEFYLNKENKFDDKFISDNTLKYAFSNLIRFFRGINSSRKPTEEQITNNLKDTFKGKSNELISLMMTNINKILALQSKKINFSLVQFQQIHNLLL